MNDTINPNGYAVVYVAHPDAAPRVCTGMAGGTTINGKNFAIFDTAEEAATEFLRWPCWDRGPGCYGILPTRMVVEERPQYVLKESAR